MTITTNEHIKLLILEVLKELESINIDFPKSILFKEISACRTHGWCRKANEKQVKEKGFKYIIAISKFIKYDSDIKNTIMHEVLHAIVMDTFEKPQPHGKEWKSYAEMINSKLGYHITRCCNLELTVSPPKRKRRKRRRYKIFFI